jgi:signal transduction histidine kinase
VGEGLNGETLIPGRDPANEAQRLAALDRYDILDTPPEATFDRIVDIVGAVFDVPCAMITLVDRERCWYKAERGMGVPELSRADNMCDVVIRQDGVFVISDTHQAPPDLVRPLLQRGLRFYVGTPLRTADGVKIGTLCAVGPRPRHVTEHERLILANLAEIVMDELELRQAGRRMAQADEALRTLNEQLETVSRNKSEFLASMSHELRTPLNGILGASEMLEQGLFGALNTKQVEYVGDIHQSGAHLLGLIEEILDLSRIEAGQMALHRELLDVGALMEGCAAVVRGLAMSRALELRVVPPVEPILLHADERRLRQVACNLLSNALKFTPPPGRVSFEAWRAADEVVLAVGDTGPGIPREFHERIFEQFFRIPGDHEGTGLGLPLARRLVELQGGRIWLESEVGSGSRFFFAMPVAEAS